jgi:excisionase family DNA binding protein
MSTIEANTVGAFISLGKAADILGVSVRTVRRRVASGVLPAFRSGRRMIRIRINDVEKLLRRIPAADRW